MSSLKGKLAVVTGGSRGIGKATARELHDAGAEVIITGRHSETLEETAKSVGGNCRAIVCDHSQPDSIEHLVQTVLSNHSPPDILVNNAGMMRGGSILKLEPEIWNRMIATNLTGVYLTTRGFLPAMIEKERGDIFMISSMSGKKGDPGATAYAASKFGLQGFSQALFHDVRKHNIRVMVLNPSRVDDSDPEPEEYGAGLTLHRNDLARTIRFLATLPGRTTIRDMDIWGTNPF